MKKDKTHLFFVLFAAGLSLFAYLRVVFNILPSEFLDLVIWFLSGPVVFLQLYFGFPEFLAAPLILFYYLVIGMIFAKASRLPNKNFVLMFIIMGLFLLHSITGMMAAKLFGRLFSDLLKALFMIK